MNNRRVYGILLLVVMAPLAAMMSGCHEMDVETRLEADGSATRNIELRVEVAPEDTMLTIDEYRALMGTTEERGWAQAVSRETRKDSGEVVKHHSFTRSHKSGKAEALPGLSGDIFITGSVTNPVFAHVRFSNAIEVATGTNVTGKTITYRESFAWTGLVESLLDYRLEQFRPGLINAYPGLGRDEIEVWYGFFRGTFMSAVDDGILEMESSARAGRFANSIGRVTAEAMTRIRTHAPGADDAFVTIMVRSTFVEWEEIEDTAEEMGLMGAVLAIGLKLTIRVDVPGRIVETNADRIEAYTDPDAGRQKLAWDVEPGMAMSRPIEIYVKTEIPAR